MASGDSCCASFMHWFTTFLAWGSIVFFCVAFTMDGENDMRTGGIAALSVCLLIYYITQFCSASCSYLMHRSETSSIYSHMERMFYTPMFKVMHIQCYHYETRTHTERDSQGHTRTRTEHVRVNTHSASERYYYISWRDISGKFDLDISGAMEHQTRAFVKLHLRLNMQTANDGTESDFAYQRRSFIFRNNWDVHYDFSERLELNGYKEHILVRVSDYNPPCFSAGWFFIFTLLTFAEFYKCHMDKYCITQDFTILKVVSSQQDLNAPQYVQQYITYVPCIVFMGQVHEYNGAMVLPTGELVPPPPAPPNMASTLPSDPGYPNPAVGPQMQVKINTAESTPLLQ